MTNFVTLPVMCTLCGLAWVTRGRENARGRAIGLAWIIVAIFGAVNSGYWQGAYLGAAAVMLIGMLHGERRERIQTAVTPWTVLFWVYLTVSASVYAGTYSFRRPAVEVPVLIVIAASMAKCRAADLRMIWISLLVSAYLEVVVGLRGIRSPVDVWGYTPGHNLLPGASHFYRVAGTLNHPIVYAVVMVIGLVIVVANPLTWSRLPRIVSGIMFFGGLYASGSRSAFVAVAIGIIVYLLHAVRLTHWVRNLTFIAMLTFAVSVLFGHQIALVKDKLLNSTSFTQRQSSLEGFGRLLHRTGTQQWFGVGFDGQGKLYAQHYLYSTNNTTTVDNMLVYSLGTMGLIGFALLIGYCGWMLYRADRLGRALLCGFYAMFFSFDVLTWPSMVFLMTLLMGAGVMSRQIGKLASAPEGGDDGEPSEKTDYAEPAVPTNAVPNSSYIPAT